MLIDDDRLFPPDAATRAVARRLYAAVKDLPLVSPHGHTDPRWYAEDLPFADPASLFVVPDHYIFRMLYSQGIRLEDLGIKPKDGEATDFDPRAVWRRFAENYHLFRGTPTRIWLDHTFATLFGFTERLSAKTADDYFDRISEALATPEFRPRALYRALQHRGRSRRPTAHSIRSRRIRRSASSGWSGRVVPAYRPDSVVDPDATGFQDNVGATWRHHQVRYADLERISRRASQAPGILQEFRRDLDRSRASVGAHGQPLGRRCGVAVRRHHQRRVFCPTKRRLFRGQMLTEMAKMSLDDGLVMQIHPGSFRNHNRRSLQTLRARHGRRHSDAAPTTCAL